MATFDFTRLEPSLWSPNDPVSANALQTMVEDFMEVVRTNPAYLTDKLDEITRFCALIEHDDVWGLAVRVVPELRRPQDYPAGKATAMHLILRTVKDKRPKPPNNDPNNSQEKEVFKKRIRESIEYIETGGTGRATDEQQRNIEDLTDRVNRMANP